MEIISKIIYMYYWITLMCTWDIVSQLYFNKIYLKKKRLSTEEFILLNCGAGEDSWEFLG